jgi:lauroyl/myristoyl acyltransferase
MTNIPATFFDTYGTTFRQMYETAYRDVCEREQQKKQAHQQKDWHFLRANLTHFMPSLPPDRHEAIYLRLLTNHWLSARSFRYVDFGSLAHMAVGGDTDFLQRTDTPRPARIFCTYHLGGYRGIMAMLLNAGYPLTLVIDRRTFSQQQTYIESVSEKLRAFNPQAGTIEMLEAESPSIGRQMAGALYKRRSVLIFLDGNTGVGGLYERNSRQLRVSFLNGTIISRTGIAVLAYATRTPIIPIISYYKTVEGCELPYYDSLPTINPQPGLPADEFVKQTTQQLYDHLTRYLYQYPDQWESWFYWHKFLDHDALKTASTPKQESLPRVSARRLQFNAQRFGLFKIDQTACAFDRQTYQTYVLSTEAFAWLNALEANGDGGHSEPLLGEAIVGDCWNLGLLLNKA